MNNIYENIFLYPKAIMLLVISTILLFWVIYFSFRMKSEKINITSSFYKYYLLYSFGILFWVLSNLYFHTGYLIHNSEKMAINMAILANISAYIACLSAFLFSYTLKLLYFGNKKNIWVLVVVFILSIYAIGINLFPGLTVNNVEVIGVSDFTIGFGLCGKYFIIIFISIISLTFLNIISLRKVNNQLRKTKVSYMFFGMIIFMISIGLIQGIIALFINDFSLTWLPPTLSVSEMILTGYAIITSRFYSTRYIIHYLSTVLLTSTLYIIPIVILNQTISPSSIYIYLYIPIVGLSWKSTFSYVKKLITLLIYQANTPPIEQLRSYVDEFKNNPKDAIDKISYLLGVPAHQMKIIKDSSNIEFYNQYFLKASDILILEEIEEKISLSNEINSLINLHERMRQNNAAIVIPIFNEKNVLSLLLVSTHKNNGRLFSREEVKTLQNIIKTAQFYIYSHMKMQKYSTLAHSIAHEVRNPLSQIQSHLDLLRYQVQHAFSAEKITHELDWTMSAIQHGNQLVDMILREVSSSSAQAPSSYLSARDLVTQSVRLFGFEDESYRSRVKIDTDETFTVKTNEVLFNFIIFNLLRNAIYYFDSLPESWIQIKLCCGEKQNYILFRDTGPGIPNYIRKRIFEEFYSHDKPNGSGLGLNYCQRVMETFGGTIECEITIPINGK